MAKLYAGESFDHCGSSKRVIDSNTGADSYQDSLEGIGPYIDVSNGVRIVKNRAYPTGERFPICLNFYSELLNLSEDHGGFDPMNHIDRSEIRDFSIYFKDGVGYCYISLERLFDLTDEEKGLARLGERGYIKSETDREMENDIIRSARKLRKKYFNQIGKDIKPIILSTPDGMTSLLIDYEGCNPYIDWFTMYWNIRKVFEHELDLMNTGMYSSAHNSRIEALAKIYDILLELKGIAQYFAYEQLWLLEPPKFPEEISENK